MGCRSKENRVKRLQWAASTTGTHCTAIVSAWHAGTHPQRAPRHTASLDADASVGVAPLAAAPSARDPGEAPNTVRAAAADDDGEVGDKESGTVPQQMSVHGCMTANVDEGDRERRSRGTHKG